MRFTAGVRRCSRWQTKLHASCRFSLNVRQPCDAQTIVLRSLTGLSQDGFAILQDCRKGGRPLVVQDSLVVVCFLALLQQPCNQAQGHFMVIRRQSCGIGGRNTWVQVLMLDLRTPCVSCSSISSRAAVLRPHKVAQEPQSKWICQKFSFFVSLWQPCHLAWVQSSTFWQYFLILIF